MQRLSQNWISENRIDFEYKKYMLLAYLQHVSDNFTEQKLYPCLSDLVEHYRNLRMLQENKKCLFDKFPGKVTGADFETFKVLYDKLLQDDSLMIEIENIISFSLPQMELYLKEGKKIYDFIEHHLKFYPVGLVPLSNDAGYLFIKIDAENETKVYEYQVTLFENPDEKYRGISLSYFASYEKNMLNSFEAIKSDLIRFNRNLPNPATFAIESMLTVPFDETLLPIAKRVLVKHIAGLA